MKTGPNIRLVIFFTVLTSEEERYTRFQTEMLIVAQLELQYA